MILLGIDPGTTRCGFGLVEAIGSTLKVLDYGLLTVKKEGCASRRLLFLREALATVIERWKPDRAGVEKLYFNRNVSTALQVGEARGVILLTLAEAGVDVVEISPQSVKLAVTGYGKADKQQVGRMVQILLKLKEIPRPDDVADALAIAIASGRAPMDVMSMGGQR